MYDGCKNVADYQTLISCFESIKYIEGEGIEELRYDPKDGIENIEGKHTFAYLYASDNNGWKVCGLLENQTDPDLNANYEGKSGEAEEGERLYCVVSSNRNLDDIDASVAAGSST